MKQEEHNPKKKKERIPLEKRQAMTQSEVIAHYRRTVSPVLRDEKATPEQRRRAINDFRCGY